MILSKGGEVIPNMGFGTGTGEIVASNYSCNGSEYYLYMCPNTTTLPDVCTHERDAALSCQPGSSEFLNLLQRTRTPFLHKAHYSSVLI